ncbi:formate dehydrogenase accessory sulfurtransferase FdhD [Marinobacter alexandrii]|uniref:formate dehydrogenase accessory sulfurtransferase FdhD n=1 Tax=Marinobacter alexandrii TaxID=2570351 RepID=UPI00329952E9
MSEFPLTAELDVTRYSWSGSELSAQSDQVIVEVPVALVYNGISHVVMMMTPLDLEDFALGFSLSEQILQSPDQLYDIQVVQSERGLELQLRIDGEAFDLLKARRRNLIGRTGCGLCGAESLEQALLPIRPVTVDCSTTLDHIGQGVIEIAAHQKVRASTGSAHAAAFFAADGSLVAVREDVGRHNALDKLVGAMARAGVDTRGYALVSSRASYEMVAKTAAANIPILAAVSAPTALAIDYAQASGLTLLGHVQPQRQQIYTHPERLRATP